MEQSPRSSSPSLSKPGTKSGRRRVSPIQYLLFAFTLVSVVGLALIFFFVITEGLPIFTKVGLFDFLFGKVWTPTSVPPHFGILYMMLTSIVLVIGSILLATPFGVGLAIFTVEYAPGPIKTLLKTLVELLAGIPSVVFGFFGIITLIPLSRKVIGGSGFGLAPAIMVLTVMILPTITAVSADALRAVPRENRLIIFALGGTRWQSIFRGVLPAAVRGILTGIILGMGRAIGETMAVLMVLGNTPLIPPIRLSQTAAAIPSEIALDMAYASGNHRTALFAMGAVLLVFATIIITAARAAGKSQQ